MVLVTGWCWAASPCALSARPRHEVLDDLEPLWLSMLDHHVEIGAAGLPVVSRDLSCRGAAAATPGCSASPRPRSSPPAGWPGWSATGEVIGEIESLAVLASERGRGIGTLLLDAAEAHLAAHGAHDVMLEVVVGNASAIAFYERRGMAAITVSMLRLRSDRRGAT